MTQFYVGTAGWSYLRWDKEFYPRHIKREQKLAYYASCFNAVELNNSFYHVPPPEQFLNWEQQVPAGFKFSIKASRYIIHIKKLNNAEEILPPFFAALKLSRKSSPVFFQLPPGFAFNPDRLHAFLAALPGDRRYVMELRDPSWHQPLTYKLLKKHKIAFCLYDTPEGISPRELTTDFAYVRLRGRRHKHLDKFLSEWKDWLGQNTKRAYVFFDNREEKSLAFGNALTFREMTR